MKRYHDMNFIMQLPPDTFIDLIDKAIEEENKDKLWEKWLHDHTELTFDQYYRRATQPVMKKSDEEVLQDAENILKMMSRS